MNLFTIKEISLLTGIDIYFLSHRIKILRIKETKVLNKQSVYSQDSVLKILDSMSYCFYESKMNKKGLLKKQDDDITISTNNT